MLDVNHFIAFRIKIVINLKKIEPPQKMFLFLFFLIHTNHIRSHLYNYNYKFFIVFTSFIGLVLTFRLSDFHSL